MAIPLTVFAIVEASEADMRHVQAAVTDLARDSVVEEGCLRYDVFASVKLPTRIVIHETWVHNAALEEHRTSAHVAAFKASLEGTTAKLWASQFEALT